MVVPSVELATDAADPHLLVALALEGAWAVRAWHFTVPVHAYQPPGCYKGEVFSILNNLKFIQFQRLIFKTWFS